ncbi:hypothetical protein FV234_14620 [Methylobacterium sp. WL8]|nr:hypothetical protein FV234_14620 [Methylobacterium sp. WL8]
MMEHLPEKLAGPFVGVDFGGLVGLDERRHQLVRRCIAVALARCRPCGGLLAGAPDEIARRLDRPPRLFGRRAQLAGDLEASIRVLAIHHGRLRFASRTRT